MRKLALSLLVVALCASSVMAADRYTTRKNVHGGFDIYKNGKYEGKAMPTVHGGYKYYLKNGRETKGTSFKGFSLPTKVGGGGQTYHFRPSSVKGSK